MANSITSANSVYALGVLNLFPVPQVLAGYSADRAFETEDVPVAETALGVDGFFAAGYVPYTVSQTIMLMAASPSFPLFEGWLAAERAASEKFWAFATVAIPATKRTYTFTNGVLKRASPMPNAGKVLQPRSFMIEWGGVVVTPTA